MARGPKKHLKRLNAPKSWMLDKLGGVFAPRPSAGPHKLRESFPLIIMLRNRMKYALTCSEVKKIVMQRLIKVDGKVRTDTNYPSGFMDVVTIEKTGEYIRLLYDVKGRFILHRITAEEAKYKLCRVKKVQVGPKGIPFLVTHDGRTIRYPDPLIKVHDTIQLDIATGKIMDFIKFDIGKSKENKSKERACQAIGLSIFNPSVGEDIIFNCIFKMVAEIYSCTVLHFQHLMDMNLVGNLVMVTGGHNLGRVGTITSRERHPGSFDIVHVKDTQGHSFATRLNYIFVIGKGNKPYISLPRGKGVKLSVAEERDRRLAAKSQH